MNLKSTTTQLFLAVLVTAIVVYFMVSVWKMSANGVGAEGFRKGEGFGQGKHEGFGGPAKGSGIPDCLRDSQEASDIYQHFALSEK